MVVSEIIAGSLGRRTERIELLVVDAVHARRAYFSIGTPGIRGGVLFRRRAGGAGTPEIAVGAEIEGSHVKVGDGAVFEMVMILVADCRRVWRREVVQTGHRSRGFLVY